MTISTTTKPVLASKPAACGHARPARRGSVGALIRRYCCHASREPTLSKSRTSAAISAAKREMMHRRAEALKDFAAEKRRVAIGSEFPNQRAGLSVALLARLAQLAPSPRGDKQ